MIALPSGEAEYHGLVKAASHLLGIQAKVGDMGTEVDVHLYIDSSAAKGIASRRGLGKMRHVEVNQLWLPSLFQRLLQLSMIIKNKDNFKN